MLNGFNEQIIAYDVWTKIPLTMEEAIKTVAWHFSCKKWNEFYFIFLSLYQKTKTLKQITNKSIYIGPGYKLTWIEQTTPKK